MWAQCADALCRYGVTEATVCQTVAHMTVDTPPSCVGYPLTGVLTDITDEGELVVGGDQVCIGFVVQHRLFFLLIL